MLGSNSSRNLTVSAGSSLTADPRDTSIRREAAAKRCRGAGTSRCSCACGAPWWPRGRQLPLDLTSAELKRGAPRCDIFLWDCFKEAEVAADSCTDVAEWQAHAHAADMYFSGAAREITDRSVTCGKAAFPSLFKKYHKQYRSVRGWP